MEGQISLSDYTFIVKDNGYKAFHEHCKHRGYLKPATETEPSQWMCGYPNGKPATCWADWIPCKECNCFIVKEQK